MDGHTSPLLKKCPVGCGEDIVDTDILLAEGCLKECSNCFHLFSQCDEDRYISLMNKEFDTFEGTWPPPKNMERLKRSTKKTLKRAENVIGRNLSENRLLDVGCSTGAFLFVASELGLQCEGVETAKKAVMTANAAGLKVHHGYLDECHFSNQSFDIITIFEVIEHIRNPVELLLECNRILKQDGVVVIRTANTNSWTARALKSSWHYFDIERHGGHISFFCRKSMETLAERTGFQMEKFYTRSVSLCQKESVSSLTYRLLKSFSEMLSLPAKWAGKGQEMEVYLRKSRS